MSRPHEDRERHTLVDHREGGAPISFAPGAWCAIEIAHVEAARASAGISAFETLVEKARTSSAKAHAAAILRSANARRVIALVDVNGHEAFAHVAAAWDDHHLEAEHRAVAESASLALYRLAARVGDVDIDPATHDAYAFEHVAREAQRTRALVPSIVLAEGFRGVLVFGADAAAASAILYRFEHSAQIDAFRGGAAALAILGEVDGEGETFYPVAPVKTFVEASVGTAG